MEGNIEILDKIRTNLIQRFGLDPSKLGEDARLRELGVDSIHVLEIMLDLEADLGVSLSDLAFPPNPTLGDVAAVISKNLAASA